jgi:predicted ABC-type ATPase
MKMAIKKPEITVFAGPNGSGKNTITALSPHVISPYINADEIKRSTHCEDLDAACKAELMRLQCIKNKQSFSFETVLSTDRNLNLLKNAKNNGYFIRGIYVLTANAELNVLRVQARKQSGGHDVPSEKVRSRYDKSLLNLPTFIDLCDVCHIYDNTKQEPKRIFKKKNREIFFWTTQLWTRSKISSLVNLHLPKI